MQKALQVIKDHLSEDIDKVEEPQLKVMFETSAEVLGGLQKAFQDYEKKTRAPGESNLRHDVVTSVG